MTITVAINNETAAAAALLSALADELDGDEQAKADAIEGETSLHELVVKAVDRIAELDTMIDALKAREDAHAIRRKRFQDQQAAIKRAIAVSLETLSVRKLELPTATVYTSPGRRRAIVTDESKLPPAYLVPQPHKIDLTALGKALNEGAQIDGAELSNTSTILNIRTR